MSELQLNEFYRQPMYLVYIETAAMYLSWLAVMLILRGRARRYTAVAGVVAAVALIVLYTIAGRKVYDVRVAEIVPFITFVYAKNNSEFYRTMYMNILLFMPLGMALPFALPDRIRRRALITAAVGFTLSACVETIQFAAAIGRFEIDDIIMNTLGTLAGVTVYLIFRGVQKHKQNKNKRQ